MHVQIFLFSSVKGSVYFANEGGNSSCNCIQL